MSLYYAHIGVVVLHSPNRGQSNTRICPFNIRCYLAPTAITRLGTPSQTPPTLSCHQPWGHALLIPPHTKTHLGLPLLCMPSSWFPSGFDLILTPLASISNTKLSMGAHPTDRLLTICLTTFWLTSPNNSPVVERSTRLTWEAVNSWNWGGRWGGGRHSRRQRPSPSIILESFSLCVRLSPPLSSFPGTIVRDFTPYLRMVGSVWSPRSPSIMPVRPGSGHPSGQPNSYQPPFHGTTTPRAPMKLLHWVPVTPVYPGKSHVHRYLCGCKPHLCLTLNPYLVL